MALLTVQDISETGIVPTYSAVSVSDTFINDGKTFIEVINGGSVSATVTVTSRAACSQGFLHDQEIAVAAGARKKIGSFETWRYNDSSGIVNLAFSAVTSVTIGVFKI